MTYTQNISGNLKIHNYNKTIDIRQTKIQVGNKFNLFAKSMNKMK